MTKQTFKDILTRLPEQRQTSVVNKTNPYLHEPPHIPKSLTHWEHANETKFWLSLFIKNRDLFIYLLNREQQITTHIKDKKLTHLYWTFLKFISVLKWLQFVSNRLYKCHESTSTCIKTTWIKTTLYWNNVTVNPIFGDHFLYSIDRNVWFRGDFIWRN